MNNIHIFMIEFKYIADPSSIPEFVSFSVGGFFRGFSQL